MKFLCIFLTACGPAFTVALPDAGDPPTSDVALGSPLPPPADASADEAEANEAAAIELEAAPPNNCTPFWERPCLTDAREQGCEPAPSGGTCIVKNGDR